MESNFKHYRFDQLPFRYAELPLGPTDSCRRLYHNWITGDPAYKVAAAFGHFLVGTRVQKHKEVVGFGVVITLGTTYTAFHLNVQI